MHSVLITAIHRLSIHSVLITAIHFSIVQNILMANSKKVQSSDSVLGWFFLKRDPVTPLVCFLHWLPMQARIDYKLLCQHFFNLITLLK